MSVDHHAYRGRVLGLQSWIALLAASLVTIVGAGFLLVPQQSLAKLPGPFGQACESEPVDIVVSPELLSVVTRLVRPLQGQTLADNHCLAPSVRSQEPQETVASADILPLSRAPQVWIPDATVWGEKVPRWPMSSLGSLASTPVVVATSVEAAKDLGWATKNPTWFQALRGGRPVIVPDYQSQSESLAVLIALWQSLGKGENAVEQVAATVLDADRSELPDPTEAVSDARSGSSNAPLFPATEQAVAYLNATSTIPRLAAVYPREGSPILDYPIFRREGIDQSPAQRGGVAAVIDRLRSTASLEVLRQSGFRRPADEPGSRTVSVGTPVGTGIRWSEDVTVLNPPRRPEVDAMIDRVDSLAKPSRILTVMDVSLSMRAQLQDGVSRIQLAGAAARLGANLLPDSGSVGLWVFAARMDGDKDYRVIERVKPLDSRSGGESHRNRLIRRASTIESHLSGGGTALYDTTIAAFRNMHANYDPKAVNVIILLSDGGNSDLTGATLDDMLAEIRKLNTAKRHVAIFTAGLGADADYAALRKISTISGGHTYRIDTALSGQRALLDGVRRTHKLKD